MLPHPKPAHHRKQCERNTEGLRRLCLGRHSTRRGVRGHHYHGGCAATVQSAAEIDGPTAPLTTSWATACPRAVVARTSWRGSGMQRLPESLVVCGVKGRSPKMGAVAWWLNGSGVGCCILPLQSPHVVGKGRTPIQQRRSHNRPLFNSLGTEPPVASHRPLRSTPRGPPWAMGVATSPITREP